MLGSAGSSRIRCALLQVIVNTVDLGLPVQAAVDAPRLHAEDGMVASSRAWTAAALAAAGHVVSRFRARQHLLRRRARRWSGGTAGMAGGGDPRRGGAVAAAAPGLTRGRPHPAGMVGRAEPPQPRLLLRHVPARDLPLYAALNADPQVAEMLGGPLTRAESDDIARVGEGALGDGAARADRGRAAVRRGVPGHVRAAPAA